MVKYFNWNPHNLPDDLQQAIGLATLCFAQSESILQDAIAGCLGLDYELALDVTTHMPMPLRFDVWRAAAEISIDDLDTLDELNDLISESESAIKKRDNIAHNKWALDPEDGSKHFVKESARGSVVGQSVPMTADQVVADAELIYSIGMKLYSFLSLNGLLPSLVERPNRHHKSKSARKKAQKAYTKALMSFLFPESFHGLVSSSGLLFAKMR